MGFWLWVWGAALAAPVTVPGTSVSMEPPDGFSLADRFTGFSDGLAGSIVITELPVPAEQMREQLTADAIATKGMRELGRTEAGGVVLLHVAQPAGGVEIHKWMRIDGDAERTVMVVGALPAGDGRAKAMVEALTSVRVSDAPAATDEGLPFTLQVAEGYAASNRVQKTQLYTRGGKPAPLTPDEPRFLVGPSVDARPIPDLVAFARERAAQLDIVDLKLDEPEQLKVAGRQAVELTGQALNRITGAPQPIYQLVVADPGGGYLLAVGLGVQPDDIDRFRAMGRSIQPR